MLNAMSDDANIHASKIIKNFGASTRNRNISSQVLSGFVKETIVLNRNCKEITVKDVMTRCTIRSLKLSD